MGLFYQGKLKLFLYYVENYNFSSRKQPKFYQRSFDKLAREVKFNLRKDNIKIIHIQDFRKICLN